MARKCVILILKIDITDVSELLCDAPQDKGGWAAYDFAWMFVASF